MKQSNPFTMLRPTLKRAAAVLSALACTQALASDQVIVTTIKPIHSLVAATMQGVGEPFLMIKENVSPHHYSLKPSDAQKLQDAQVIFLIGEEFEQFMEPVLDSFANDDRAVALLHADNIKHITISGHDEHHDKHDDEHDEHHDEHGHEKHDEHHDEHGHKKHRDKHDEHHDEHGHEEGSVDTHIWLDPHNAKAMVIAIAAKLSEIDPDNADAYQRNRDTTITRLERLDDELAKTLIGATDKPYFTLHNAFGYFEQRYDVQSMGSVTTGHEVGPGAKRLRAIRKAIKRRNGSVCIFSEPQINDQAITQLVEDTGAKTGVLDPIGAEIKPGPNLYFELMRANAESLARCLKG